MLLDILNSCDKIVLFTHQVGHHFGWIHIALEVLREMTLVAAVVDWENFFEEDGITPLICNDKNIIRASREIVGFNEIITKFRKKLASDVEQEQQAQEKVLEKNSSSG